jgi:hypothetical protein
MPPRSEVGLNAGAHFRAASLNSDELLDPTPKAIGSTRKLNMKFDHVNRSTTIPNPAQPHQPRKLMPMFATLALAAALGALALSPQAAKADPRDHGEDRGHYDRGHRGPPPRDYRRGYGYPGPDVVYAPPPVVYAPEPSPGISLFLPINIR